MSSSGRKPKTKGEKRPFLGLRWECCGLYTRVYRSPEASHYNGRCPGCGKAVRIEVASGGTDARFFSVR